MAFTDEQKAALDAKLDKAHVRTRQQSGRALSYVEGWFAISEANRIFGFDAWTSETVDIRVVAEKPRKIGQQQKDGWSVSYIARVRITVGDLIREGVGAGHGIDVDLGLAHESAIKEAETDARKRALMTFGNPFGLALYDKAQANVESAPAPAKATISKRAQAAVRDPQRSSELAEDMIARLSGPTTMAELLTLAKSAEWQADSAKLSEADYALVRTAYGKAQKEIGQIQAAAA